MPASTVRLLALGVDREGEGSTRRFAVRAVTVLCVAQLLMFFGNVGRIPFLSAGDRSVTMTLNEFCVGAIVLVLVAATVANRSLRLDRVALAAMAFAAIGAGSSVWSVQRFGMSALDLVVSLLYLARWLFYFCVYLAVINAIRDEDSEALWRSMEASLLLIAGFGFFQAVFLPDFAQMVYPEAGKTEWDAQGHRLMSTILEPNVLGVMLMIGLLVQLARASAGARVPRWRALMMFAALVLTLSRSAAVGMVVGIAVILAARGLSRYFVRLGGMMAVPMLLAVPILVPFAAQYSKFNTGTTVSRLESWILSLRMISDYPTFGVGFNAYRFAAAHYGVESFGAASSYAAEGGLLYVTAMTGLVGVTVYCLLLGLVISRCRSIWRDPTVSPESRGIALGTAAGFVATVVASVFVNAILSSFVMQMMWMLAGITFLIARARDARAVRPAPTRAVVALAA